MTLAQLRHLIALARTASFSKAAAESFVTQSALSRSLQALEADLGLALIERGSGRRVQLTAFGRATLERAQHIVQDADELRATGARQLGGQVGNLRIGMGSGPGAILTGPLLAMAVQQHPRWKLEVVRGTQEMLLAALRARELDAIVADARSLRPEADLRQEPPIEMRGGFLVRPGHPLLSEPAPLHFERLLGYPVVSTPLSDDVARSLVQQYGAAAHPELLISQRSDEVLALVELARHSDAIVLAVCAAAPDLQELPLLLPLRATALFSLYTLQRRAEPPALHAVRGVMLRCMAQTRHAPTDAATRQPLPDH